VSSLEDESKPPGASNRRCWSILAHYSLILRPAGKVLWNVIDVA
jgi:hypothetical protein